MNELLPIILKSVFILLAIILICYAAYKFSKSKYFDPFLRKIDTMLDEGSPKLWSSQRFNLLLTLLASNLVVWGLIFVLSVWNGEIVDVPESVIALYLGANGIAGYFKKKQKEIENSKK